MSGRQCSHGTRAPSHLAILFSLCVAFLRFSASKSCYFYPLCFTIYISLHCKKHRETQSIATKRRILRFLWIKEYAWQDCTLCEPLYKGGGGARNLCRAAGVHGWEMRVLAEATWNRGVQTTWSVVHTTGQPDARPGPPWGILFGTCHLEP